MQESTYNLKKGTEFPEAFAGLTATYNLPSTIEEIRALVSEEANADEVIVAGFNGQGYNLSVQKRIKQLLDSDKSKDRLKAGEDPAAILADVVKQATEEKIGAPRKRGESKTKKVAEAQAKAEQATNSAREMYLAMPAALRKQFRPQLIAAGTFTAEQLDEMDSAKK